MIDAAQYLTLPHKRVYSRHKQYKEKEYGQDSCGR
jgi:hypothetical protein